MYDKYRVSYNDTLDSIAKKYNTSPEYLSDINIPKSPDKYFVNYKIDEGDTLYKIAQKYTTNPALLAALNGLDMDDYIYPNDDILLPTSEYSYYITKEGDTLNSVSSLFRKSPEYIIKENATIYLLPGQIMVSRKK